VVFVGLQHMVLVALLHGGLAAPLGQHVALGQQLGSILTAAVRGLHL
jgi:hypothetical protein